MTRPNVLLITLDQFRADCLSAAGHPLVRTPHLDALADQGVRFARHYSQAAPCAPGRASLYTGMYQFNHRVVGNGSPLDRRFDNVALAARRAGYDPTLFGYTDQAIDPRDADGPQDPRLSRYTGILPGFSVALDLPDEHEPWLAWLAEHGVDVSPGPARLLASEHARPESLSVSAFLTDRAIDWIGTRHQPWFAHLSYLRPHPPYDAAGEWSRAYTADDVTAHIAAAVAPPAAPHWFHRQVLQHAGAAAPAGAALDRIRAQYLGMIGHVDRQLGRLFAALGATGAWDDTLVIVVSDHGELLGDHGLLGKLGYWEQSYATPCIVRDPRHPAGHGQVVEAFTENVDVMPTICEAIGVEVPAQCDGVALTRFLAGERPTRWRDAAHWEFDWRTELLGRVGDDADRTLERQHLAVLRNASHAYVQFGNGDWLCFDLDRDPAWQAPITDADVVLPLAQAMLTWRSVHTDRVLADMVCEAGGIGRWPPLPDGWADR